eukprot:CAMPEP_0115024832 /NCGR_PEP_ID=MMETSP0216-20121206/33545_1 /TAXON_ID=223996 /ORGANISM="Protocruzia adherens, Strain Boccale" /LENGTH=427 /DNA_ID=CAMNT_0002399111 /DNA_START=285 /DNA_END=1568 /DNA_ORIENTATION=+
MNIYNRTEPFGRENCKVLQSEVQQMLKEEFGEGEDGEHQEGESNDQHSSDLKALQDQLMAATNQVDQKYRLTFEEWAKQKDLAKRLRTKLIQQTLKDKSRKEKEQKRLEAEEAAFRLIRSQEWERRKITEEQMKKREERIIKKIKEEETAKLHETAKEEYKNWLESKKEMMKIRRREEVERKKKEREEEEKKQQEEQRKTEIMKHCYEEWLVKDRERLKKKRQEERALARAKAEEEARRVKYTGIPVVERSRKRRSKKGKKSKRSIKMRPQSAGTGLRRNHEEANPTMMAYSPNRKRSGRTEENENLSPTSGLDLSGKTKGRSSQGKKDIPLDHQLNEIPERGNFNPRSNAEGGRSTGQGKYGLRYKGKGTSKKAAEETEDAHMFEELSSIQRNSHHLEQSSGDEHSHGFMEENEITDDSFEGDARF